jgi:BASS family bile acid:Na+ symporter
MRRLFNFVESNLVWFVLIVAGVGLIFPESGKYLGSSIAPLLAILMFVISLTFDADDVRIAFRKPSRQFLAMGLVYGPMSIAGFLTGRFFLETGCLLQAKLYLELYQQMYLLLF